MVNIKIPLLILSYLVLNLNLQYNLFLYLRYVFLENLSIMNKMVRHLNFKLKKNKIYSIFTVIYYLHFQIQIFSRFY